MTGTQVWAEQVRTLFRQRTWVFLVNPLNALILALALWPRGGAHLDDTLLVPVIVMWLGLMVAVTVVRLGMRRSYLAREPPTDQAPRWARSFVAGTAVTGALWGAGVLLLYDPSDARAQVLVPLVAGGMIAGSAAVLASYLPAFFSFAVPIVVATAARFIAAGDALHLVMALFVVVYGAALSMVAGNNNRALSEAFRLRFEKQDLLEQLSRAQLLLEEVNRTLEQRVAERGAAFERQSEVLRDAQRMESVGLLAGGVAHDFNNLLTVIMASVGLLQGGQLGEDEQRVAMDDIQGATHRAASLVNQLLAFSRRQVLRPRVLELGSVVRDAETLLRRLIGERIQLKVATGARPLFVRADPLQIEQVIINLATNARDAMPSGGVLTIETEAASADGVPHPLPPGRYAALSVRDTGVGMDSETMRRSFDPFFTTKDVGQGTGLGLATVHGIVEQSGGHVFVDSVPRRGSCFRVYLPEISPSKMEVARREGDVVTDRGLGRAGERGALSGGGAGERSASVPAATAAETRGPSGAQPRVPATVLLTEDEVLVREVAARILTGAGHRVLEAKDGEEALEVARRHPGPIDLLITDLVMARVGGLELVKRLAQERPGLRVLFISGYSWEAAEPFVNSGAGGVDLLQKPFSSEALIASVARLLAGPPPRPSDGTPSGKDEPRSGPHRSAPPRDR
jgi:signal transduction histidine kinase/CheY-like chemotaxis protein